jgi:hypothetical protein
LKYQLNVTVYAKPAKIMETLLIALPTISQVTFEIILHEEDMSIRGNCLASGDDKEDEKCARMIERQLANGNSWAWCCVEVRASYKGLHASDYLGGCSYKSERDFKKGGYYEDMKSEAFNSIIAQLKSLRADIVNA